MPRRRPARGIRTRTRYAYAPNAVLDTRLLHNELSTLCLPSDLPTTRFHAASIHPLSREPFARAARAVPAHPHIHTHYPPESP